MKIIGILSDWMVCDANLEIADYKKCEVKQQNWERKFHLFIDSCCSIRIDSVYLSFFLIFTIFRHRAVEDSTIVDTVMMKTRIITSIEKH